MKINDKYSISMDRKTKSIKTNLISGGVQRIYTTIDPDYHSFLKILQVCRKRSYDVSRKNFILAKWIKNVAEAFSEEDIAERLFSETVAEPIVGSGDTSISDAERSERENKRLAVTISEKIIKFFSEFNFTPSLRFINTLANVTDRIAFTINYFNLQNHSFAKEIADKVKSVEFKDLISDLNTFTSRIKPTAINTRFELYFGEPGTGKTTEAISKTETCIVCSSDMLPVDLMQNFAFSDGKAEFQKSDLWIAMEKGKTIVMDEINMLPFESLRFLQGLLDNKPEFNFKGFTIKIHPEFKVIGTMNLNVSGQAIPLPAPLVDRCGDIKEYEMNAKLLAQALI